MNTHAEKAQKAKSKTASVSNSDQQRSSQAMQFQDNRPQVLAQMKMQEMADQSADVSQLKVIQMKWDESDEAIAQEKLMPIDNHIIEVPTWNVLNQQAWAGFDNRGKVVQWGEKRFQVLQSIDADKVVARAAQIMEGKVTVDPPPVAFSSETAQEGNPQTGELVLLDSHHTINAARILREERTIPVMHIAKPSAKGNSNNAEIAASRAVLTRNKNIAKNYNQNEIGLAALAQAADEIMKMKNKATQDQRLAEDSHKARSYDFQNGSDLKDKCKEEV